MTGAQRSYLNTLATEAGEEIDENLTKAEALKKIDELQQKTGRGLDNQGRWIFFPTPLLNMHSHESRTETLWRPSAPAPVAAPSAVSAIVSEQGWLCGQCAAELRPNARFCSQCGATCNLLAGSISQYNYLHKRPVQISMNCKSLRTCHTLIGFTIGWLRTGVTTAAGADNE